MSVSNKAGVRDRSGSGAEAPFNRFAHFASCDAEEVQARISQVFCEHDLRVVGRAQTLTTELSFRPGCQISYGRLRYGATVDINPGKLKDFYLLQLPVQGEEHIYCGARDVKSNRQVASIISPEFEFHMRHQRGAEKLFLRIERGALERQYVAYYGEGLDAPLNFAPAIHFDDPGTQALARLLRWQLDEATHGTLLDEPLIAAQFEEALMLTLLVSLEHNQRRHVAVSPVPAPAFIRRAEAYIEYHAAEPLTAAAIAADAGVSIRSLFDGYRKYRGISPMQHLRRVRLDAAHARLSDPHADTTVTDVAVRFGFDHLGRFSACYRKRFGELPSATLRHDHSGV